MIMSGSNRASSFVEVLVSMAIVVILVTAAAMTILNSQFLASYSKHKIQAMYAAQQIIEQQRRLNFSNIVSQSSAPVTLDSRGTYNTSADDFLGNAVITVVSIDANRKQVQVQINWQEQLTTAKVTMREYYSTIIANDPLTN